MLIALHKLGDASAKAPIKRGVLATRAACAALAAGRARPLAVARERRHPAPGTCQRFSAPGFSGAEKVAGEDPHPTHLEGGMFDTKVDAMTSTIHSPDFRELHPDFEELLCEIDCVRAHNFEIERGASQQHPLIVAEGALIILALERFLRIVLAEKATSGDTLHNLLEKAASGNDPLFPRDERMIKALTTVRNVTMHGNFEQGAANYKHKFPERGALPRRTVAEFLRTSFGNDTAVIYGYLLALVGKFDPECARDHMVAYRAASL